LSVDTLNTIFVRAVLVETDGYRVVPG